MNINPQSSYGKCSGGAEDADGERYDFNRIMLNSRFII